MRFEGIVSIQVIDERLKSIWMDWIGWRHGGKDSLFPVFNGYT